MRGRKPTPTAHLEARGSWRAKTRPNEPKPELEAPKAPAHLNKAAKAEWNRVVPLATASRVLTASDRAALAVYCVAWARWVEAEGEIAKNGAVISAPSGYQIQSPWLAVANKAMEQIHKLSSEFGFTPASRARVHVTKDEKPKARLQTDAPPVMRIAQ